MKGFVNYIPAKFVFGSGVFDKLSDKSSRGARR